MSGQRINRISGIGMMALSLAALLLIGIGYIAGYTQPPRPPPQDEGTLVHIFQLTIVAVVPTILLFLASADWRQPLRAARPLAFAAVALVLAFGALYYGEHYWRL